MGGFRPGGTRLDLRETCGLALLSADFSQRTCGALPAELYSRRRPRRRPGAPPRGRLEKSGAIAQLGERFNGIEEVVGSIPSGSTNISINCDEILLLKLINGFNPFTIISVIIQAGYP